MKDFFDLLQDAASELSRQDWFRAAPWTVSVSKGEWAALQLSRTNWFNEDGNGIHFETWLSQAELASGLLTFQAHVMHSGMTFPGTSLKAGALSRPILARHRERIRSWGYHVPAIGGMGLLSARVAFTPENLTQVVVEECTRFATLGEDIDQVLHCLLQGKRPAGVVRTVKAPDSQVTWAPTLLPSWEDALWCTSTFPKVAAEVTREPDGTLRVEVTGSATKNHHAILACGGLSLQGGTLYRAGYEVRAEVPRWMTGNIRGGANLDKDVGIFKGRTLTPEWQTVEWQFLVHEDVPRAEMWFALGKVPNRVWFRRAWLQPALTGQP